MSSVGMKSPQWFIMAPLFIEFSCIQPTSSRVGMYEVMNSSCTGAGEVIESS